MEGELTVSKVKETRRNTTTGCSGYDGRGLGMKGDGGDGRKVN